MKALVIDLGRSVIRYGLVSEANVLQKIGQIDTPEVPFVDMVGIAADKLEAHLAGKVLAVAAPGPFFGSSYEPLKMPNGAFDADELLARFQPARLIVVHDVIGGALGASLVGTPNRVDAVPDDRLVQARSPRSFIQTGVGLGVAALLPDVGATWLPLSGEGGSIQVAPCTADEARVYRAFRREPGRYEYPTAQALLSSATLCRYGTALRLGYDDARAEDIALAARADEPCAARIVATYAGFLGSFAASVALMFRSYNGVSIAGFLPSGLPEGARDVFLERFQARGSVESQLKRIPIDFIDDEYLTLTGLASLCTEVA